METFNKPISKHYVFSVSETLQNVDGSNITVEADFYDNKEEWRVVTLNFILPSCVSSIYSVNPGVFIKTLDFWGDKTMNSGESVTVSLKDGMYVLTFSAYGNHSTILKLPLSFMTFMQELAVVFDTHHTF